MILGLPKVEPGDEISADHIAAIYDALQRLQITVSQNCGITMDSGSTGITLGLGINEGFWIKLTSRSSNSFAWTEQIHQAGDTWVDGYQSGTTSTDPAHEVNGNSTLPTLPVKVWAWRVPASNEVTFNIGTCS